MKNIKDPIRISLVLYTSSVLLCSGFAFCPLLYSPHDTNIHVPNEFQTRNPSKRSAADPRLRPFGHWDRRNRTRDFPVCSAVPQPTPLRRTSLKRETIRYLSIPLTQHYHEFCDSISQYNDNHLGGL